MSGGALDYGYDRIADLAHNVEREAKNTLHRAFAAHLRKVALAAHDLEWELSGDTGTGDADQIIRSVVSPLEELDMARAAAEQALKDLAECLERVAGRSGER